MPFLDSLIKTLAQLPSAIVDRVLQRPSQKSGHGKETGLNVPPEVAQDAEKLARLEKIVNRLSSGDKRQLFLPLQESYTAETEEMRRTYPIMLKEPHVKSALLSKVFAVASLDIQVQAGGDRGVDRDAADFVKYALKASKGGTREIVKKILMGGLIAGFSVSDKLRAPVKRGRWAGKWGLKELKSKDPENIQLLGDEFRNITGVRDRRTQDEFHPSNFVIFQHLSLYENATGMSDLRAAYRAFWLKNTAWQLRAIGMERYGLPIMKGTYVPSDDAQRVELEAKLPLLRSQSWINLPEGAKVEALDIASRSQADFASAIADLNEEIVIGITGAFLQMLGGQVTDGRGDSKVHRGNAELLQWELAAAVGDIVTDQIVPDLVDPNFEGAERPIVTFGGVNDNEMAASITIDQGLLNMQVPLSKAEVYQRYGRQEPTDDDDKLMPAALGAGPLGLAAGGLLPSGPSPGVPQFDEQGNPVAGGAAAVASGPPIAIDKSKAIVDLQKSYFKGDVTREAAIANAIYTLQVDEKNAESLFPIVDPSDLSPGGKGGITQAAEDDFDEEPLIDGFPEEVMDTGPDPEWLLALPNVLQRRGWDCGVAATKCAHQFLSAEDLPLFSYVRPLGSNSFDGTPPANIEAFFRDRGFSVTAGEMTPAVLQAFTRLGRPVLCPFQQDRAETFQSGHWVVVRGCDGQTVWYQDVSFGPVKAPVAEFLRRWHDVDAFGNHFLMYGIAVGTGDDDGQPAEDFDDAEPVSILTGTPKKTFLADEPAENIRDAAKVSTPPEKDVAGSHADAAKVQLLLNAAEREGSKTLAEITSQAIERHLAAGENLQHVVRLFDDAETQQLADALAKTIGTSTLMGRARVRMKQNAVIAAGEGVQKFSDEPSFTTFADEPLKPMAPAAALEYFQGLVPSLRGDPFEFGDRMRRTAFTLAHATDQNILNRVKSVITDAIAAGTSGRTASQDIQSLLDAAGVSPKNPQYAENVFRTNTMDAYNDGTMAELRDPDVAETFPAWEYLGIRDGRQRPEHEYHFNRLYPNSADFREVRDSRCGEFCGYNCRCTPRPVSKYELLRLRAAGRDIEPWPPLPGTTSFAERQRAKEDGRVHVTKYDRDEDGLFLGTREWWEPKRGNA